jgi:hypothetical protein
MMNFGEETESLVFTWFRFGGSWLVYFGVGPKLTALMAATMNNSQET